jgi:cobalt-precorrin 5A hydrolase/precorrin-3B C17-methyltransferase
MRTMVLIGSSTTCTFPGRRRQWVYTPRWYGEKPQA